MKYNALKETLLIVLWKKLESLYMLKSLTNHLYLKKELYQLRMDESIDIQNHLNIFKKLIFQLPNVGVKINNKDKTLLLLTSLSQSYKSLVIVIIVEKEKLKVEEIIKVILDYEMFKKKKRVMAMNMELLLLIRIVVKAIHMEIIQKIY